MSARFPMTYCSQCGAELGPGNSGVSHCEDHQAGARHTPGPWEAKRNSSFWEVKPINGGYDGLPFTVADVCASAPGFPDAGLQEANARLIAAAPELMEALQELVAEYEPNIKTFATDAPRKAKWMAALNAIAKATGEA